MAGGPEFPWLQLSQWEHKIVVAALHAMTAGVKWL